MSRRMARRSLCLRSSGLQPAKRARKHLEAFTWSTNQQLAGYTTSGQLLDSTGHNNVASVAASTGAIAFIQASGILNIYGVELLHKDIRSVRARADRNLAASQSQQQHSGQQQNEGDDASDNDSTGDGSTEGSQGQDLPGCAAWRRSRRRAQGMAWREARAGASVDALPPGGVRLSLGMKLDDVAWDPRGPGRVAVVGSSSHNITVVEIGEGTRRKSVLASRGFNGGQPTGPGFTSLKFFPQGPYSVAAASTHSARVCLWDARRGSTAIAEIGTPGRCALQGPLEVSPCGTVVYGLAQGNQLLLWDVRKGSQSSGVLQFGATGPYHHGLIATIDLNSLLASAAFELLGAQGEGGEAAAGVGGSSAWPRWAGASRVGSGGGAALPQVPSVGPVDQVAVDPGNPGRLGLVTQNCGAAVLSLGSAPHITHLSLPPHAFHPSLSLAGPHRYHDMALKRCAWAPGGGALWVPHLWLDHGCQPASLSAGPVMQLMSQVAPQGATAGTQASGGNGSGAQGTGSRVVCMGARPALAAVDCRGGSGLGWGAGCVAAWATNALGGGGGALPSASASVVSQGRACAASRSAMGAAVPGGVRAAGAALTRARSVLAATVEEGADAEVVASAQAAVVAAREALGYAREVGSCPSALLPVSDWVTSVAVHPGSELVFAGTYSGMLLCVGHS